MLFLYFCACACVSLDGNCTHVRACQCVCVSTLPQLTVSLQLCTSFFAFHVSDSRVYASYWNCRRIRPNACGHIFNCTKWAHCRIYICTYVLYVYTIVHCILYTQIHTECAANKRIRARSSPKQIYPSTRAIIKAFAKREARFVSK